MTSATTDKRPRRLEGDRLSKLARHKHIISQLTAAPTLRASELAAVLGVSGETICLASPVKRSDAT